MSLITFGTSPEARRHLIVASAEKPLPIDANKIAPRLWQGADPPKGGLLRQLGFRVLVLCAEECQYPPSAFPGIRIINAPMDDAWYVASETARRGANQAAELWRRGAPVLITCHMGLNRSGLVSALTLRAITGCSGNQAMLAIQRKRPNALYNKAFQTFLKRLP
jgi:protein-tyrosine phosphatase